MKLRPRDCFERSIPYALADGRVALLRPVGPEDAAVHLAAMRQLSPAARSARFLDSGFTPTPALSRYLTGVDQEDHVAWGATVESADGVQGAGMMRFVRGEEGPDCAEFAVTVVDAFQGLGLGRALLCLAVRLARRQGLHCLVGLLREDNHRMVALLRQAGAELTATGAGLVEARLPLRHGGGQASGCG